MTKNDINNCLSSLGCENPAVTQSIEGYMKSKNRQVADDALQDLLVLMMEDDKWRTIKDPKEQAHYLQRILFNKGADKVAFDTGYVDSKHRQRCENGGASIDRSFDSWDELEDEGGEGLPVDFSDDRVLQYFSRKRRTMIEMLRDGHTMKEISEKLGWSEGTVRAEMSKAIARAKQIRRDIYGEK